MASYNKGNSIRPDMPRLLRHPAVHGLISALLMIVVELRIIEQHQGSAGLILPLQAGILGVGVLLSIYAAKRSTPAGLSFLELFQSGFRHFIVVTLAMVLFTFIHQKQHPEYAKQVAQEQRAEWETTKKYTVAQLDEMMSQTEKQFVTVAIYGTVFRYLMLGAVYTAVGGLVFSRKK